jgi:hypothetical protein
MNDIPAFPRPYSHDDYLEDIDYLAQDGMTLRDYFAAKAMQALIQFEDKSLPYESRNTKDFDDRVSYQAYRYADAMMKAREA